MTFVEYFSVSLAILGIYYNLDWAVNCSIGAFIGGGIFELKQFIKLIR